MTSPPAEDIVSDLPDTDNPPPCKAQCQDCSGLTQKRGQELVAFARSLPTAEQKVLLAEIVLTEMADCFRG